MVRWRRPKDELVVHPRRAWAGDAQPPVAHAAENDVRFLLVHHSAVAAPTAPGAVAAQIAAIHRHHTGPDVGWPDVCYHFFVDPFGGVWEGRAGSIGGPVVSDATGGDQGFARRVLVVAGGEDEGGELTQVEQVMSDDHRRQRDIVGVGRRFRVGFVRTGHDVQRSHPVTPSRVVVPMEGGSALCQ